MNSILLVINCLHLALIITEIGDLSSRFAIFRPQSINGALPRPFFSLGIFSALSVLLLYRRHFDRIGSSIRLLFLLLLVELRPSRQLVRQYVRILPQCRIGAHRQSIPSLTRRQFPVLIRLLVDMAQRRIGLALTQNLLLLNQILGVVAWVETHRSLLPIIRRRKVHILQAI